MTVNETVRADVRRRIMESAEHLTTTGSEVFTRARLWASMARGASSSVFAHELGELRAAERLFEVRPAAGARPALYSLSPPAVGAAPDWAPGYPSAGTMIGPAWRAMWAMLAENEWCDALDLAGAGAEAGGCLPNTARNLLYQAVKGGLIEPEVRLDRERNRWRTWYRRARREAVSA